MRILIVDDRSLGIRVLREPIEEAEPSYKVEGATTAGEARDLVQDAKPSFDVFLIDQNLGLGPDGIELMVELHRLSPGSDTMIFTGYDDLSAKQRAIEAGACDYFTKPLDLPRLLAQLHRLQRERSMRDERNWLQTLTEIAEEMQGATTEKTVADVIVRGALRFGFLRARLRVFAQEGKESADDPEVIGVSQAGTPKVMGFEGLRMPLSKLLYSQKAIAAGQPLFFRGRELGPGGADEFFASSGIHPPLGEWIKVPILSGKNRIGSLTLDNGEQDRLIQSQQREQLTLVLGLFGKQAAAALERARLHERASLQAQKAQILSDIGRAVTTKAAQGSLEDLLETVREQLGKELGLDISSFMTVLLDTETGYLDFRCHYERGVRERRHWREYPRGLVGHLMHLEQGELLLFQNGSERAYRETHQIETFAELAQCWLGVPLRVDGKTVGALVLLSYDDGQAYDDDNKHLLAAVADQVAGAVQSVYRAAREHERTRQLEVIQRVSAVLPRLAREDEDRFWHTILTAMTIGDGLSFNRAALFLYDEDGARLRGRSGIGDIAYGDAHAAWHSGEERDWNLEKYLALPGIGSLAGSPLERLTPTWEISTDGEDNPFQRVRVAGEKCIISYPEIAHWLPNELAEPLDLPKDLHHVISALIPLQLDGRVHGVVVVDNAFDGEPLASSALDNLSTLLSQAAQDLEQARAIYRNQAVLRLSQRVMAGVSERSLREGIKEIANEAKRLTGADLVAIYPLQQGSDRYDRRLVVVVGPQKTDPRKEITDKPRQLGVTGHILRAGTLVVSNVDRSDLVFGEDHLSGHSFLSREGVKAFIGVPIYASVTGDRLGVLYIDYLSPRRFTESDIALAEDLAQATAAVIRADRDAGGRELAETVAWGSEIELRLLHDIQEESLTPGTDEKKVIRATLKNGMRLFETGTLLKVEMLEWDTASGQARPVWHEYALDTLGRLSNQRAREPQRKLMENARQTGEIQQTGLHFVIPIRLSKWIIGAIQIELPDETHFTEGLAQRAERLATAVALALDNVRRLDRFRAVLKAAKAVTEPLELGPTLKAVVAAAQEAAPGIECVTIWYQDPISAEIVAGPQWGLLPGSQSREGETVQTTDKLVSKVMARSKPVWAEDCQQDDLFQKSDFVKSQNIKSSAAFPLRADDAGIGALFFSYRQAHSFTPDERELFPIFAEITAASLQDARKTQYVEQKQLEAERDRASLKAAARVSEVVGASLDLPTVLEKIIDELYERFKREAKLPIPYVLPYDSQANALMLALSTNKHYTIDNPDYRGLVQLPLDSGIKSFSLEVAQETLSEIRAGRGRIIIRYVDDLTPKGYIQFKSDTKSELCAGLVSANRFLGVLVLKSSLREAFNETDEQLFKLVAEQVALAIDRAEQAIQQKFTGTVAGMTAWASEVAHDLRLCVGSIDGYLRDLYKWPELPIDAKPVLERMKEKTDYLVKISKAQSAILEHFALYTWLDQQMQDYIRNDGEMQKVSFRWAEPVYEPQVFLKKEPIWRGIRHIVNNAKDAMTRNWLGDRVLLFRLRDSCDDSSQIELHIMDSGPGVPLEIRSRLFYEQCSLVNPDRGNGGLLARFLIESAGGTIKLEQTEIGKGTTIRIRLPRQGSESSIGEDHAIQ